MPQRIAIIGGGVAGLTAGYLLQRRHAVTLFEKSARLGGNAYTAETSCGESVDIAVAAFGRAGYPLFYRLLRELGVKTRLCPASYMSFHNLDTGRGIYVTPELRGLIAQRFALLHPARLMAFARLLLGVSRGRRQMRRGALQNLSLAQALDRLPELQGDARIILISALCLLSSMSAQEVLASPAAFFFHKLDTHHDVVSPKAVYSVRAVDGFTRAYVSALAAPLDGHIITQADIQRVHRDPAGVRLQFSDGRAEHFDSVVLACNADTALQLLEDPTQNERRLLGPWAYKDGRVVLHRDRSSFPPRVLSQAYTFLYTQRDGVFDTSVNGDLRHEPGVSKDCDLISSQHPNFPIDPATIELDTVLRTPYFDHTSVATVDALPTLNGDRHSYFCGSYFGHGLHEDAIRSAVHVAHALGVDF